jgi:hypothetical protein
MIYTTAPYNSTDCGPGQETIQPSLKAAEAVAEKLSLEQDNHEIAYVLVYADWRAMVQGDAGNIIAYQAGEADE